MIKKLVNRFLGWKLPKDFSPDGGISFKESAWWPVGTNLLTATQAEEMFRHALGIDGDMLTFGDALMLLENGQKVARLGWNGVGLWLELQVPDAHSKMTLPYIYINYPDNAKTTPGAR